MTCPVCQKPMARAHRPFCSARCADLDLGRWMGGHYRMPAEPAGEDDMAAADRADPHDPDDA